ncbi:MAG: hypothetical protein AABM64_00220 [Pseudomonadota bacterium]
MLRVAGFLVRLEQATAYASVRRGRLLRPGGPDYIQAPWRHVPVNAVRAVASVRAEPSLPAGGPGNRGNSSITPQGEPLMEGKKLAGMALAATAAALFMTGCANMGGGGGTSAKVHCEGANACKGMSDCKSANSSCHGQNACKGQGFVSLTPVECQKVSGRA